MDGRLIFLHHGWRTKASGRCGKGERHISKFPKGAASRKGEGNYDPKVLGTTVKKSRRRTKSVPVLKLTQVGEMKILRRSRERS